MAVALLLAALAASTPDEMARPTLVLAQRRESVDLLPKPESPTAAAIARQRELERQLAKRRTLLLYHQIGGFLTVGSLTATAVLGQLDYHDKYGGGGDVGTYRAWHRWVAAGSSAIFAGTAALAILAPVPVEKPPAFDTATVHKIAMTVAAAGMVTQIVLGIVTASKEGQYSQRDFALAHQIIGYATLGATLTGFTVLTF